MKILVLDDREESRYLLESLLKGHGHEVDHACNGAVGLAKAKEPAACFDLIICDILMPVMDGFQFCQKVRADPTLKRLPLIFYTATYTGPQDEEFALRIGANRFLRKPCEPDELLKVIQEVMTTAHQHPGQANQEFPSEEEVLRLYSERLVRKLEQKMLEAESQSKALLEEKLKFKELFDQLPLGLAILSPEDSVLFLNPRFTELFGYVREDVPTLKLLLERVFLTEETHRDETRRWQNIKSPANHSDPGPWVTPCHCRDGSIKEARLRVVRLVNEDWLITCEDVSNQIRMETRLRQAQKMEALATLAGGISHDFNNILTVVIGNAELAERALPPSNQAAKNIQTILLASKKGKELIGKIHAFTNKTEQGRVLVPLHQLVTDVLSLLRSTLPATVKIREIIDGMGFVFADPTQMHQVLMNLCTNAFYAMKDTGGTLEVSLKETRLPPGKKAPLPELAPGPYLELSVTDTGKGMPKEILGRIFEPYFSTKPDGDGTGLGLAITHGIVKACSGGIDVSSIPGVGSTFRVYLPSVEAPPGPAQPPTSPC